MTVGDLILKYREEHHMSQRQFALKCGMSNGYIAMIEKNENPATGKPLIIGLDKLKAIANVLHMPVDELMRIADVDTTVSLSDGDGEDAYVPKTVEARIVSFGMDKMSKEEREKVLEVLQIMYRNNPNLFRKDEPNDP